MDIEDNPPSGRPQDNILNRTFLYPKFMDKTLVTPAVLNQIGDDQDGIVDRFQWAGRILLKAATILRCSEPMVSVGIQVSREVKDLGESIHLLKVKKLALEEAKQKLTSDFEELKEVSLSKDRCLEEKGPQLKEVRNRSPSLKIKC